VERWYIERTADAIHIMWNELDRIKTMGAGKGIGEGGVLNIAGSPEDHKKDLEAIMEKIDMAKNMEQEIFKAYQDRIDKQRALETQRQNEIEQGIEYQMQLAVAGQKNTLDFMLREKAKSIERQKELDKKAQREKEAQQVAELFLEFMKVYAKDGFGASAKALAQTLLAKGISEGISGSFFEGTDDTGAGGNVDGKGGMLAVLHPHEGVVTRRANETNPGLVKALNDGLVDEYFKMNYQLTERTRSQIVNDAQHSMLAEKIDQLIGVVKGKTEWTITENLFGELVKIKKQNGMVQHTTVKSTPIIKRNKPFA